MFINEIVVHKNQGQGMKDRCMQTHDIIFYYRLSDNHIYTQQYTEYKRLNNGTYGYYKNKYGIEAAEKRCKRGKTLQDVWDISAFTRKRYPTEKPYKLLKRIICLSTK